MGNVSLCITTYNNANYLDLVLQSVLNQSILPNEILIADDGSSDNTVDIINKYRIILPIPIHHYWQEDRGFRVAKARNIVIKQCAYEYIIFIDSDILLHKDFIKGHLKSRKDGYFIQGSRALISKEKTEELFNTLKINISFYSKGLKNRINAIPLPWLSALISKIHSANNYIGTKTCNMSFWKKDALIVNGFNEDFEGWGREDNEFIVRLINSGIKRFNLKFSGITYHIWHKENSRKNIHTNQLILESSFRLKKKWCNNGIIKTKNEN